MNHHRLSGILCACVLTILGTPTNAALVSAFQGTGTYGLDVDAVGISAAPMVDSTLGSGSALTLSNITPTATVTRAYLYAYDINHPGTISATFNGSPLLGGTSIGAYASDAAFNTLYTYRWDVTNQIISGVTSYNWAFSEVPDQFNNQGASIGMAALAVVFSDPNLSTSTVTIHDGMTYVGNTHPETESININGLPAGSSTIYAATFLDDNLSPPQSTGETIVYNGSTIGGPLDKSLTLNGSLTPALTGTSVAGTNTLSIKTQSDEFGWTLAATITPVPLPAVVWLFATGLLGLIGMARRKKSV